MKARAPKKCYWQWKSILGSKILSQRGVCLKVGNVVGCYVMEKPWVPTILDFKLKPKPNHLIHVNWVQS